MNNYVIGYDKGIKKDRSSLIISKYNNSNLYVLAEFYDEKADLLNEIITTLQQENKQLKSILTELEKWLKERIEWNKSILEEDKGKSDLLGFNFHREAYIKIWKDTLDKIQELKEKYK